MPNHTFSRNVHLEDDIHPAGQCIMTTQTSLTINMYDCENLMQNTPQQSRSATVHQCENRLTAKANNKLFLLYVITVHNYNSYFDPLRVQCTSVRPATRYGLIWVQFPVGA
jgi:hypothetical protein